MWPFALIGNHPTYPTLQIPSKGLSSACASIKNKWWIKNHFPCENFHPTQTAPEDEDVCFIRQWLRMRRFRWCESMSKKVEGYTKGWSVEMSKKCGDCKHLEKISPFQTRFIFNRQGKIISDSFQHLSAGRKKGSFLLESLQRESRTVKYSLLFHFLLEINVFNTSR